MNINIYNPYVRQEFELYHHGVAGQKWGKRNGPPYPLAASAHSASEKKAGWRKSLNGGSDQSYSKKRSKINSIYSKAMRKQRNLTEREKKKIHKEYIARMNKDEIEQFADWARQHEAIERNASEAYDAYLKKFESDPKRKKIVDNWSGDGTELYMKMQEVMPDKNVESATDREMTSILYGERLAKHIAARITSDDKDYYMVGPWKRGENQRINSDSESFVAIRDAGDRIKEIDQMRNEGQSVKKIAKKTGTSEKYVNAILSKRDVLKRNYHTEDEMRNLTRQYELEEGIRNTNKKKTKDAFDREYLKNAKKELKDLKAKYGLVDPYKVTDPSLLELMLEIPDYKIYKKDIQKQFDYVRKNPEYWD